MASVSLMTTKSIQILLVDYLLVLQETYSTVVKLFFFIYKDEFNLLSNVIRMIESKRMNGQKV
jgi:hypothetical protein